MKLVTRGDILSAPHGLSARLRLVGPRRDKAFFEHVREGVALVVDLCTDARMQQEALEVVEHTCKLFQGMYEGVAERHLAVGA